MSDDGGEADQWAYSEWRDWAEGRHARDSETVLPHAGDVASRSARRVMSKARGAYERAEERGWIDSDEWPDKAENTEVLRSIRTYHRTEHAAESIQNGDGSALRAMIGSQEESPDLSSLRTIQTIEELLTGDASMTYIFGHMGNGKSFAASLFAEIFVERSEERVEVASNTRTIEATEWINNWGELKEWMEEPEDTVLAGDATRKLFILDEASSVASGRGTDGYNAAAKLATMCYKIRKYDGSLIIIGHDGKDVHPAVREMCTAFHKTGTKTGRFYREVRNRSGEDPISPELDGIPVPDPEWQPNTYDTASWSWKGKDGEELDPADAADDVWLWVVRDCFERGLSAREAAENVRYSRDWTSRRYRWLENDEFPHDRADRAMEGIE